MLMSYNIAYKLIKLMKIRHCKRYKVYLNDVCKVKSKAVCDKQLGALYCTDVTCVL